MNDRHPILAAALALGLSLGLGVVGAGWFVGRAVFRARAADRYVTVRGFSEREIPANLALWPIVFSVTADDLGTLQARIESSDAKIRAFLRGSFDDGELSLSAPRIEDREAARMGREGALIDRYAAVSVVTVRARKMDVVRSVMERTGELVKQGVALVRDYEYRTQYFYTDLEKVKPEMIAEATRDARRAAEQFATDSGSSVGGIRNAQQGLFSIEDRDPFSPEFKKVRVVTTIQYFLLEE